MADNQSILSDLARAKAVFQLRTVSAVLGLPEKQSQPTEEPTKEDTQ